MSQTNSQEEPGPGEEQPTGIFTSGQQVIAEGDDGIERRGEILRINNYTVTKQNFIKNPIFGTGLGSHEFAYDKYSLNKIIGGIYEFNTGDANSLFLRTVSEVGLMGIIFIILFAFKYFVSNDLNQREIDDYWLIGNALLVLILLTYIRQGNYTYNGFFMYCWMYFYNSKNYNEYSESLTTK